MHPGLAESWLEPRVFIPLLIQQHSSVIQTFNVVSCERAPRIDEQVARSSSQRFEEAIVSLWMVSP